MVIFTTTICITKKSLPGDSIVVVERRKGFKVRNWKTLEIYLELNDCLSITMRLLHRQTCIVITLYNILFSSR